MKKKNFRGAKALLTLLAMLIPVININNVNAEDTYIYDGDYTIEAMIKNYNIVTLGQRKPVTDITGYKDGNPYGLLNSITHVVGPVLVQGNFGADSSAIYHSQRVNGVSSYIAGKIVSSGAAGGNSADGTNPKFYVGTTNEVVQPYPPAFDYHINGYSWYTKYETIETDKYIDFSKLYTNIKEQQTKLEKGTTVTKDASGVIYVETGGTYTIESLTGVNKIVFTNYANNQTKTTLITITDKGDSNGKIVLPEISSDAGSVSTPDYIGASANIFQGNIVWNITDASYITPLYNTPIVGHIIAPQADLKLPQMHFAGCVIVNSIEGVGGTEAHYFPFQNETLPTSDEGENDNTGDSGNNNNNGDSGDNNNGDSGDNNNGDSGDNNNGDSDLGNDNTGDSETDNDSDNDSIVGGGEDNNNQDGDSEIDSIVGGGETENPDTFDSVTIYGLILIGSLFAIIALGTVFNKLNKQNS